MKKQYYLKIYQSEIERFSKRQHNERLIYESIKSYSANGRDEVTLSVREIASRASISYSTVYRYLPKVISMGVIKCVDLVGRVGGKVNTYKVLLAVTENNIESVSNRQASVANSKESVSIEASNHPQYNKVKKEENSFKNTDTSKAMSIEVAREVFAVLGGKI